METGHFICAHALALLAALTILALPANAGETPPPNWRVIVPPLQSERPLVVAWTVQDFGAKGDGTTDDTAAFQKGLDALAKIGGGTLYAPAGRYAIRGNLTVPGAVTLAGDWQRPEKGKPLPAGTILMVYGGRGEADGKPFISVKECGGVRGLTLWWPEQKADDIQPYPYAFKQLPGDSMTLAGITLVNAYRGVLIGPDWNELHFIQDLHGTVLELGISYDFTTDIGRLEEVTLAPWIWSSSGLPGAPGPGEPHTKFMKERGTGILMLRSDWEYAARIFVSGYRNGFSINGSPKGFPNAQFWKLEVTHCTTALDIRNANEIGLAFTSCIFAGDETGVAMSEAYTSTSLFHDCAISGTNAVTQKGRGVAQFQHCTIKGPVSVENGAIILADSEFSAPAAAPHITLGTPIVTSAVVGNRFDGAPRVENKSASPLVVVDHAPLKDVRPLPALPDTAAPRCRPAKNTLFVATDAPYSAKRDGKSDDTAAIQAALDAAGKDGGGIVFLPGGSYAVRGHLQVPAGVELRGVYEVPHHSLGKGSILLAWEGKGSEKGEPFIALAAKAGVRGVTVHYPDQEYDPPRPYPTTIQGRGAGVYVVDTTGVNPWYFIDLATHRCDGHVLDYVGAAPIKTGIAIGAGCRDGQVRNMQLNPHYFHRGSYPKPNWDRLPKKKDLDPFWELQKENLDSLILGACERELLFQNFVFGSLYGIHLIGEGADGPSGWCIGHGTDGSKVSARIDGLGAAGMDFINAELVCMASTNKVYFILGPTLKAEMRFFSTLLWGQPDLTAVIEAGTLHLQLANLLHHGAGLEMKGGAATAINTRFNHGSTVLKDVAPTAKVSLSANLLDRGLTIAKAGLTAAQDRNAMTCVALPPGEKTITLTLNRAQERRGLRLREKDGEAEQAAVERGGRWGWRCEKGGYMYLEIDYAGFKNGAAPQVTLSIEYFDEGKGKVSVVYDAAEKPWVEAGVFELTGSNTWKRQEITIEKARFSGRCNGADIRLNLQNGARPVLGSVTMRMR